MAEMINKHEVLAGKAPAVPEGKTFGPVPNQYWLVLADDFAADVPIPEYAGLKIAYRRHSYTGVKIEKNAPRLGNPKVDERILWRLASVFYWRFWNARA